jgi:hypothetical protein
MLNRIPRCSALNQPCSVPVGAPGSATVLSHGLSIPLCPRVIPLTCVFARFYPFALRGLGHDVFRETLKTFVRLLAYCSTRVGAVNRSASGAFDRDGQVMRGRTAAKERETDSAVHVPLVPGEGEKARHARVTRPPSGMFPTVAAGLRGPGCGAVAAGSGRRWCAAPVGERSPSRGARRAVAVGGGSCRGALGGGKRKMRCASGPRGRGALLRRRLPLRMWRRRAGQPRCDPRVVTLRHKRSAGLPTGRRTAPAQTGARRTGYLPAASISRTRLSGRMSVQFVLTYSRHASRVSWPCATVQPGGTSAKAGQSECCPSSLTST